MLTAHEAKRRGMVATVGLETIRRLFATHELKPWRKKMLCVPKLDPEYIRRMEELLLVLSRPANERAPVVALDEPPVQPLGSARPGTPMAVGKLARCDHECTREGTANAFCIVEPKRGRHHTHATRDSTRPRFAAALRRIARCYPAAQTIRLLMDNLNTHCEKSLIRRFGIEHGRKLWAPFTVHYTPKHASWLNPAELVASLWSRECLGRDRIATFAELSSRTRAWNAPANRSRRRIDWRFTTADARRVFDY